MNPEYQNIFADITSKCFDPDIEVFICDACNKFFGIGIPYSYWRHAHINLNITFELAFENFKKEFISNGGTAILLPKRIKICPYCASIKIRNANRTDFFTQNNMVGQVNISNAYCSICNKYFIIGVSKYLQVILLALGITNQKSLNRIYKKHCTYLTTKSYTHLSSEPSICQNCKKNKLHIDLKSTYSNFMDEKAQLTIYSCTNCKRTFACGIDRDLFRYYLNHDLSYQDAFKLFKDEYCSHGATADFFIDTQEKCPYCKSDKISEMEIHKELISKKLISRGGGLEYLSCRNCKNEFTVGFNESFDLLMRLLGARDFDKIFELYLKKRSIASPHIKHFLSLSKSCPICNADAKMNIYEHVIF